MDCSIEPQADCVVVAVLDGEMLIKQLGLGPAGEVRLKPANPRYPTVTIARKKVAALLDLLSLVPAEASMPWHIAKIKARLNAGLFSESPILLPDESQYH